MVEHRILVRTMAESRVISARFGLKNGLLPEQVQLVIEKLEDYFCLRSSDSDRMIENRMLEVAQSLNIV